MRIAPELYLKRLLVGGFEKVFELNRNFRNEGIDTRHNPEFTSCEFYWAYANFHDLMDLTEELFARLARKVCGGTVITYQGQEIDLTPGKWTRMSFYESLTKIGGHSPEFYNDYNKVRDYIRSRGEKATDSESLPKLHAKLFDLDVEEKLIQPHFIYHYPTEISPLSRRNNEHPDLTDRFELFIVCASKSRCARRRPATTKPTPWTRTSCAPWNTACPRQPAKASASTASSCC